MKTSYLIIGIIVILLTSITFVLTRFKLGASMMMCRELKNAVRPPLFKHKKEPKDNLKSRSFKKNIEHSHSVIVKEQINNRLSRGKKETNFKERIADPTVSPNVCNQPKKQAAAGVSKRLQSNASVIRPTNDGDVTKATLQCKASLTQLNYEKPLQTNTPHIEINQELEVEASAKQETPLNTTTPFLAFSQNSEIEPSPLKTSAHCFEPDQSPNEDLSGVNPKQGKPFKITAPSLELSASDEIDDFIIAGFETAISAYENKKNSSNTLKIIDDQRPTYTYGKITTLPVAQTRVNPRRVALYNPNRWPSPLDTSYLYNTNS